MNVRTEAGASQEPLTDDHPFSRSLDKNAANHVPLTPVSFLSRAASAFADKTAVIDGDRRFTFRELDARCRCLASALAVHDIGPLDTVAVLASNIAEMIELHFAVPMLGAVLNPLNTRLDPDAVAFSLSHGGAKILFVDAEHASLASDAIAKLSGKLIVVGIGPTGMAGAIPYDDLLGKGSAGFIGDQPSDEWQSIGLLYTSGTTGDPKGVVYSHRGAYLQALGNAVDLGLGVDSVYLWTLPMFHCSGWSYPWAAVAAGATQVCLPRVDPSAIYRLIAAHGVTHLCGAPIVLSMIAHAPSEVRTEFSQTVRCAVGGAAPTSTVIREIEARGFRVTQFYGTTESYGPATACIAQPDWNLLDDDERHALLARQGAPLVTLEALSVVDMETGRPVPMDGMTIGEVRLRGNTLMKGYLLNQSATEREFEGGWYHTGDLAVWHKDGIIAIKDRAKDIIISGGENISSLEVEEALARHPAIDLVAVVARPDAKWGETPCAFIELRSSAAAPSTEELQHFCRERLARFKVPKTFVFIKLPKTSTGKIVKNDLREQARAMTGNSHD